MTYHLTFTFPKEQYSIDKGSNEFSAKDKEGNRFIITADSNQKGKFSFCKDDGSECKFTQHYAVKDPKICNKLSDIDSADYINVIMEGYGEKYFQSRILGGLNKCNIDYAVVDDGKTQDVLHSPSVDDYATQEDANLPPLEDLIILSSSVYARTFLVPVSATWMTPITLSFQRVTLESISFWILVGPLS